MKKLFLFLLISLIGVCCGCRCTGQEKTVVIDRSTPYEIVLPELPDKPATMRYLRQAAEMLKASFKSALGLEVPIVTESKAGAKGGKIYIGNTEALRKTGLPVDRLPAYAFFFAEKNGDLYIAGRDGTRYGQKEIRNMGDWNLMLGSFNGCVKFAEKYLQTRFLFPTPAGVDYAKELKQIRIPAGICRRVDPPLGFANRGNEIFYNYSQNFPGYGTYFTYGGHSYYDAVPAKVYWEKHPEYFALDGGKRTPNGNHLCISNPEVQNLIYKEVLKRLDDGAVTVQLAQTDGYRRCKCEKCLNLFGTTDAGEQLWILHRNLARRLLKDRPGKNVHLLSYGKETGTPPKTFRSFPSNVVIELCDATPEGFAMWKNYRVPGGFTVYIYNWGWYNTIGVLPKTTPQFCADQVRFFKAHHVKGVYRCGTGECFGLEAPSYYVFGQMFGDPSQNAEMLFDDFCKRAYHESYRPMKSFFEILYNRLAINMELKKAKMLPENPRIIITTVFSPDVCEQLENNLAQAEQLARDSKVKARLKLTRIEFDYVRNLANILHLYNAYRINPDWAKFDALGALVEKRNAMIDSFYDKNGRSRLYDRELAPMEIFAHISKPALKENGRSGAVIGAPLNWNIRMLKEKKVLPGSGKKRMIVRKAKGAVTDDFSSAVWKAVPWQELNGIQLGAVTRPTRVKSLYDGENCYFAFEAMLPAQKKITPCGQDGCCWNQDCAEVILDPGATRRRYFHFIINPAENSCYDEACGLITDVLHPLYNKPDRSWNGKWSYTTKRVGDKWYAMVVIPFASMGEKMPAAGAKWGGNFGREAFSDIPRKEPELQLWSPNLENMTFHDMDTFGELVFQ